ncbi:phage tail protein [Methylovulum psychrotolerans]|uniref:Tip attachment protein J domain-containing protein n=1 Tax=Methylovulum psychrotolerans TaxID=1704499 RepID=A0A1Z4C0G2_9GAMM|nr:phage tail protein [Methylovulum psychrotolerans]ASF46991.1 hypothetical protein CEK71_13430 [Methylovulum psychrotolerans]
MSLFGGGGGANTTETKIGSFKVMSQGYGVTSPVYIGTNRGNLILIDYMDFYSVSHPSSQGGKGGGGSAAANYTYYATVLLLVGEGGGYGVNYNRLWVNKDVYATPDLKGFAEFDGADGQEPWTYMEGKHPTHALAYKGFAYLAAHDYELTNSASLGNHSVEVGGFYSTEPGGDATVANAITGLLLNAQWGCDFGAARLLSLSLLDDYCQSYGIVISPALTEQIAAHELMTKWATIANSAIVWTENAEGTGGALKFVPYSQTSHTANGRTYLPVAPLDIHLTDDDFLVDGDTDPIVCSQTNQADTFNALTVEFKSRAKEYNKMKTPEYRETADIDSSNYRPGQVFVADEITLMSVAQTVAQNQVQRSIYVIDSYDGTLTGWQYAYLEPMDVVYIIDEGLGLDDVPVLITSVSDNDDTLAITFEELPDGLGHTVGYAADDVFDTRIPWNVGVGDIDPPVLFHAPGVLAKNGYEVWVAIAHPDERYGGCQVWASFSDDNYQLMGAMNGSSTIGSLTADFASGSDPDYDGSHLLKVALSSGKLAGASHDDAKNFRSLCLAGTEFVSYTDAKLVGSYYDLTTPNPATLTGAIATAVVSAGEIQFDALGRDTGYYDGGAIMCTAGINAGVSRTISTYVYDTEANTKTIHCAAFPAMPDRTDVFTLQALPYLRRGLYGSSRGAAAGAAFVRCDSRIFKIPYQAKDIGSTLNLKFLSYNQYGQGLQSLADAVRYSIVLSTPLQGTRAGEIFWQWGN